MKNPNACYFRIADKKTTNAVVYESQECMLFLNR